MSQADVFFGNKSVFVVVGGGCGGGGQYPSLNDCLGSVGPSILMIELGSSCYFI